MFIAPLGRPTQHAQPGTERTRLWAAALRRVAASALLIASSPSLAGAPPDIIDSRATMRCGKTLFAAHTRLDGLTPIEQEITAHTPGGATRTVDLRERRFMQHAYDHTGPALDSVVGSWTCLRGLHGRYVILFYSCNAELPEPLFSRICTDTQEWVRYLTARGALLDRGYREEDRRYRSLERTLGMPPGSWSAKETSLLP